MIEVFLPGNEDYSKNGDMVLLPTICDVRPEINSTWTLELEHIIDKDGRWSYIKEDGKLRVNSFNGSQLFTIKKVKKTDTGVQVKALPVFLDSADDCFIIDIRPTNKTGQEALNDILSPNAKYSGKSNITKRDTSYFVLKNAMEAITGAENSFMSRWGGEIIFNNYEIIINDKIGGDYGVSLLYGKNIPENGISETVDISEVITRIIPEAYNGYLLPGNNPYVDSPLIDSYPTVKTKLYKYSHIRLAADVDEYEDESQLIICDTMEELYEQLRAAAAAEFDKDIDKPKVYIDCKMQALQNTEEYADFKELESVSLGDTIYCKHKVLNIVTTARVTSLVWDCITETIKEVFIGSETNKFMDRIVGSVKATEMALTKDGNVLAEQIQGIINGAMTQLKLQNTIAKKQNVRAIIFEDLDPNSPTFGASAYGTQGWQISKERTPDGKDWVWTTASTAEGIFANVIIAGLLTDKLGKNYWNLDTGDFSLSGATITDSDIDGYATDDELSQTVTNLEGKINGKAETYYQSTDPSINWSAAEKANHKGDLWYRTTDNTTWYYDGSKWVQETISDEVFDKIDGKAKIFITQPTTPYNVGDLWFNSATSDIMTCIKTRATGNFTASDWQKRNKYTDDSSLTTFISGTYATDKTNLQGQIDKKAETWYQSTDPSTAWTTPALKAEHKGDLWFNTTDNTTWYYDGSNWVQETIPTEVFNTINGKAQIFTTEPVNEAYNIGDLWLDSTQSDIKVAMASRAAGAYNASDWVKRDKYASARDGLENILRNTYNPEKKSGGWDAGTWEVASGGNGVGTIETVSDSPTTYTDKAFRITDNASGNRDWRQYAMPLDNQRKYAFSAWCRGIGGEVTSQVRLWANQQSRAITTNTKVIGTNWTYIEYEYDDITSWNTGGIQVQFGLAGTGSIEYIDPRFIDRTALKEATDRIQVGGRNLAQKALWGRYAGGTVYSGEWENTTVDGYTITATAAPHDIIGAVCPNVTEDKVTVSFETNATSNVKAYWRFRNPMAEITKVAKYDDDLRILFTHKFDYPDDNAVYGVLIFRGPEPEEAMSFENNPDGKYLDFVLQGSAGTFRTRDTLGGVNVRPYIKVGDEYIYGTQIYVRYEALTLQKNMLLTPKDGKVSFTLDVPDGSTELILGVGQYPFASEYYIKNLMVESSTKASNWSPAPEDIDKAIDDIAVGGTNLLKGTRTLYTNSSTYGTWKYGAFYRSGTGIIDRVTLTDSPVAGITKGIRLERTTEDTQIGFTQGAVPVRSGQAVFSVWIKGAVGTKILLQPYYRNSTEYARKEITLESTEWTRYTVPFEFKTAGNWSCGYVYIMQNQPIGTEVYVCAPKVEYGNKATDWSESPYDAYRAEGGRNLLKKSNVAIAPTSAYALGNYYFGDEKPIEDEVYTIQIKGSLGANRTNWLMPYNSGGSVSGTILNSYTHTAEYQANNNKLFPEDSYDEATGIYTAHIVWKVGTAANTYLRIYQQPNDTELDQSSIEWIKMEKGYVATDWEPAPEDVEEGIAKAIPKYGTCTTAGNVAAKVVECEDFILYKGATVNVNFTNQNTVANPTLNINGTGAKAIRTSDGNLTTTSPYSWKAGSVVTFVYDGTYWRMGAADIVGYYDQYLNQTKVFNKLTNDGAIQGIFMKDGQLYVNLTYLQGGIGRFGGVNNNDGVIEILNAQGNRIIRLDNNGQYIGNIENDLLNPNIKFLADSGEINGVTVNGSRFINIADDSSVGVNEDIIFEITGAESISKAVYYEDETKQDPYQTDSVHMTSGYIRIKREGDERIYPFGPRSTLLDSDFLSFNKIDPEDGESTVQSLAFGMRYARDIYSPMEVPYLRQEYRDSSGTGRTFDYFPAFVPGEIARIGVGPYAGHITNSSKDLVFWIPYFKSADGMIPDSDITLPTNIVVRGTSGYVNSSSGIAGSALTVASFDNRMGGLKITLRMKNGSAFTNVTNNTPVSVMFDNSYIVLRFKLYE